MRILIIFKKRMINSYIFSIIIHKFSYKKEICRVILFKINKNSELNLYCTVLLCNLTICLKIKSNKMFLFDTKKNTLIT